MRKMIWPALFITLFIGFTFAMARILTMDNASGASNGMHISVVMYGSDNNDRWNSLEQGIRQACRELLIESPTLDVSAVSDAGMQQTLVEREIASGINGLLLAPENSEAMAGDLEALYFSLPTVYVKNGIPGYEYVSADDLDMARLLAESIQQNDGRVVLVEGNMQRQNVRIRVDAFVEHMQETGRPVERVAIEPGMDVSEVLHEIVHGSPTPCNALVAPDTETLEWLIDAYAEEALSTLPPLYGISASDKAVHALNQGIITGMVFENEYALGYIATMQLAAKMGLIRPGSPEKIQYMYVDRITMFEPDVERLLFPIV